MEKTVWSRCRVCHQWVEHLASDAARPRPFCCSPGCVKIYRRNAMISGKGIARLLRSSARIGGNEQ